MFLIVKVAQDQTQPGSLLARSRGRKMRDPGNEVVVTSLQQPPLHNSNVVPTAKITSQQLPVNHCLTNSVYKTQFF